MITHFLKIFLLNYNEFQILNSSKCLLKEIWNFEQNFWINSNKIPQQITVNALQLVLSI